MNKLNKLYLTEINGNMNMRLSAVNQLQGRRSESTVVDKGDLGTTHFKSSQSCEVTSLQRIQKEAKALLNPFENRLKKGSRAVQKTFSIENLTKVMHEYYSVINLSEHSENLDEKLYNILSDPCFLLLAYSSLRKDAAAGLDGVDSGNVTLSGIRSLSKDLKSEKYTCVPSRRIYIDKPQGGKRPLGVPSMRDKIVQKGLLMLLQPTFERSFSDLSHGFRPMRSCHTALRSIRQQGNRTTWFIELDLVNAFEKVHHELLLQEIKTFVSEQRILDLIYKMLKVGYVNPFDLSDSNLDKKEGTPQGSILSPFFANIFFSRLDSWVENVLLPKYNRKRIDTVNPEYSLAVDKHIGTPWNEVLNAVKERAPSVAPKKIRKALREVRKDQVAKDKIKYYATDPNHRKLWYVRYADDMLLGFIGPKSEALGILEEIKFAVDKELKMLTHPKKSGVKHHSDGVLFLGYNLLGKYDDKLNLGKTQRQVSNRIKFSIPTKRLIKRYANKGFLQIAKKGKNTKYVGRRVDKWIYLPEDALVIKRFNAVLRGIANYYSGSEYPSALYELWELLRRSAALTLAHRRKMRTAKSAFHKWGRDLTVNYEVEKNGKIVSQTVQFEIPDIKYGYFKKPGAIQGQLSWLMSASTPKGASFPKSLSGIVSASELPCCIPKCPNMAAEWHHITPRKRQKGRTKVQALMVAYKARQLPVCSEHHKLITYGKYDGPSLRKLPSYDNGSFK